jgi:DNA helicase-2/ATP-dependent DNA helicase PcrA
MGLKPDFGLLTLDEDRISLLEEAIRGIDPGDSAIPSDRHNLLRLVDRLFADSYDGTSSAPTLVRTPPWLPTLFRRYCECLINENRLDFGALLHFARLLLTTRPHITRVLRLAWTHFCVDEFQDTNRVQYDFLRALVGEGAPNLFVVADDDQIIYQWNGASPERLQLLQRDYQMTVIQLPENYRCPPTVVELANNLIAHNELRTPGKLPLVASRQAPDGDAIWYSSYDAPEAEASGVAASLLERHLNPEDCVVLARTTKLLDGVAIALRRAGFEAYMVRRKTDFETPAVRWMFNMIRLANGRHDRDALKRVCGGWGDIVGLPMDPDDVAAAAALTAGDFLRAWHERALATPHIDLLKPVLAQIGKSLVERMDFLGLVQEFLQSAETIWSDDFILKEELATWRELHDEILGEHGAENATLHLYLQEMALRSKAPTVPPRAIRLLTIHGAKGLEFKHVFLVGMSEDICPSYHSTKGGARGREMEEERRNCFVAITRVQETLQLSRARTYNGYTKEPSRFLREMGLTVS